MNPEKTKMVKMFRVRVGDKYCSLNTDFHELGVAIPDTDLAGAHVFKTRVGAAYSIDRMHEARKKADGSMYPEFKGWTPLRFSGVLEVEEFQVETTP